MTRKKVIKILMSISCDGYKRGWADLLRAYRAAAPGLTNAQLLAYLVAEIDKKAIEAADKHALERTTAVDVWLYTKNHTPPIWRRKIDAKELELVKTANSDTFYFLRLSEKLQHAAALIEQKEEAAQSAH